MRVVRLLIYEGQPAFVLNALSRSKPEGVHNYGQGMVGGAGNDLMLTVITLPEAFAVALEAIGQDLVQRVAEAHEGKFVPPISQEPQGVTTFMGAGGGAGGAGGGGSTGMGSSGATLGLSLPQQGSLQEQGQLHINKKKGLWR